jgi:hypothetical protein
LSHAADMTRLLPHPGTPPTARTARLWVALLVLAIALASFVHVAHSHDAAGSGPSKPCPCWSGHDRVAPPPTVTPQSLPCERPAAPDVLVAEVDCIDPSARPFQARAPPQFRNA